MSAKLLLEHWQENQFTVERLAILLQYVKDNKQLPPFEAIGQPMEDVVIQVN